MLLSVNTKETNNGYIQTKITVQFHITLEGKILNPANKFLHYRTIIRKILNQANKFL